MADQAEQLDRKEWTGVWDTDGYTKIWVIYSEDGSGRSDASCTRSSRGTWRTDLLGTRTLMRVGNAVEDRVD